ncbi:MAG: sensor domain-containing diguanylate cyclase [Lachnospiraceae bacterium]|nr:sensor domain-containing diguanylate cyclase [Lachnospiraceae bacterium]
MGKKQNVRPQTIAIVVIMTLAILALLHQAFDKIRTLYKAQLNANALELREHFLENTVTNLVGDINTERKVRTSEYEDQVESCIEHVHLIANEAESRPEMVVKEYFDGRPDRTNWTYMAYDRNTNDVIYDSAGLLGDAWDGNEDSLKNSFISVDFFSVGDVSIIYGITKETLNNVVKNSIQEKVSYNHFEGNTWLWINEIRNYDGGKNYAVRYVNPESRVTEGRLLSTDEKDQMGKEYLKEELDSLNEKGSAQYTYLNKNKDGIIAERVVYSALYKDYDWIVGMSADMDDIERYVEKSNAEIEGYIIKFEIVVALIFLILLGFMVVMTVRSDREFTLDITKKLKRQVERDALTKATSRQYGEEVLKKVFEAYKKGKPSPAIMLLDVDHFKEINDTYGHDIGDVVLKRVVMSLYHTFRKSDYLIRWGGDEFVGVYLGLDDDGVYQVAKKVMDAVHEVKVVTEDGQELNLTASVGIAGFAPSDKDYTDGIRRADNMLYDSKAGGRNQFHIAEKNAKIDENKNSDSIARG